MDVFGRFNKATPGESELEAGEGHWARASAALRVERPRLGRARAACVIFPSLPGSAKTSLLVGEALQVRASDMHANLSRAWFQTRWLLMQGNLKEAEIKIATAGQEKDYPKGIPAHSTCR